VTASIVSALLALVKALPWFQKLVDEFFAAYLKNAEIEHSSEFVEAVRAFREDQNTEPLEGAIGSDNAGKPATRREGVRERSGSHEK